MTRNTVQLVGVLAVLIAIVSIGRQPQVVVPVLVAALAVTVLGHVTGGLRPRPVPVPVRIRDDRRR